MGRYEPGSKLENAADKRSMGWAGGITY